MAFNTNRLARVYQQITDEAAEIKRQAASLRAQAAAGNVQSTQILDWFIGLGSSRVTIAALASTPGLADYARNESSNESYDVAAEYTTMLAAIDGSMAWVTTNFPKDGSGYLLARQFSGNTIVDRSFNTAATAGLRTLLDSLTATIG